MMREREYVPHAVDWWSQGQFEGLNGDGPACLKTRSAKGEINLDFISIVSECVEIIKQL